MKNYMFEPIGTPQEWIFAIYIAIVVIANFLSLAIFIALMCDRKESKDSKRDILKGAWGWYFGRNHEVWQYLIVWGIFAPSLIILTIHKFLIWKPFLSKEEKNSNE